MQKVVDEVYSECLAELPDEIACRITNALVMETQTNNINIEVTFKDEQTKKAD